VHLSFCPRPIVPRRLRRLGQPKKVADAGPSPESEPDDFCTPSLNCFYKSKSIKRARLRTCRRIISRFSLPPPRAIEIDIVRALPNARATALRYGFVCWSESRACWRRSEELYWGSTCHEDRRLAFVKANASQPSRPRALRDRARRGCLRCAASARERVRVDTDLLVVH
jgi:hypothetical protein